MGPERVTARFSERIQAVLPNSTGAVSAPVPFTFVRFRFHLKDQHRWLYQFYQNVL